jgi:predicted nuclease of predicted toxin-antitoxin system
VKLLLDANVGRRLAELLRQAGYDVERVAADIASPSDEAILAYAFRKKRILLTQDPDLGESAIRSGRPHSGIIHLKGLGVQAMDLRAGTPARVLHS